MIEKVEAIINDARERFNAWVGTYEPWQGENHTTERNLSFQFATAFLKKYGYPEFLVDKMPKM